MDRLRPLIAEYQKSTATSFFEIIKARLSKEDILSIKRALLQCQCCLRHQTNRNKDEPPVTFPYGCVECDCVCRHYYRMLQTVYPGASEPFMRILSHRLI